MEVYKVGCKLYRRGQGNDTAATMYENLLLFTMQLPERFSDIYSSFPTRSGSMRIAGLPFLTQRRTRSTVTPFGFVRLESSST